MSPPAVQQPLRYADLGPLVVQRNDIEVPIRGRRLTAALGVLLVHVNQRVSIDALVDALWGDSVPDGAEATLDSHLYRLRKLLEPDRRRGSPFASIVNDSSGYRLVAPPVEVDSARFEELAGDVRSLSSSGQFARALDRCDEALVGWRGRPWAPHSDEAWAAPSTSRIEELREQIRERRIDCLLEVGEPEQALADCEALLVEFPLREHLWGMRMLAESRLGRTDDALATYAVARATLIDELGIEPGSELQELQQRILDTGAELPGPARPSIQVTPSSEIRLPRRRGALFGRAVQLAQLAGLLERPLVTVVGPAGCGKSRIVVEAAREAASAFPDGVWFVECGAALDSSQLAAEVCAVLGLEVIAAGTAGAALHTYLRTRRLLLVLDTTPASVAPLAELVDLLDLVDGEAAALVASREPLGLEEEHVWELSPLPRPRLVRDHDPADPAELAAEPAVQLYSARAASVGAVLDEAAVVTAARICAAVDGLPLAIELAAGQSRSFTQEEILERVLHEAGTLRGAGRNHEETLADLIHQSVELILPIELEVHQAASVVQGEFTAAALASIVDLPDHEVRDALAGLVHRSLMVPLGARAPGRASRFRQLAAIRSHASRLATPARLSRWTNRRNAWVAKLASELPRSGAPEEPSWRWRVDDDLSSVRATLQDTLAQCPSGTGAFVAARLGLYWFYRGMAVQWEGWTRLAFGSPDADPFDKALVGLSLACALGLAGRTDLARPYVEASENADLELGREQQILLGEHYFALADVARAARDANLATSAGGAVSALAEATGDETLNLLAATASLGLDALTQDPSQCLSRSPELYARALADHNHYAARSVANVATMAALQGREIADGLLWSDRTIASLIELAVGEAAGPLTLRGSLLALDGDFNEAARVLAAARAQARRAGFSWPRNPSTWKILALVDSRLSPIERDHAVREGNRLTLTDLDLGSST